MREGEKRNEKLGRRNSLVNELQSEERKAPSRLSLFWKRVQVFSLVEEGVEVFVKWLCGLFSVRDERDGDGEHVSLGDVLHDFGEKLVVGGIIGRDGAFVDEENHRGVEVDLLELAGILVARPIVDQLVLCVHCHGNRIHLEELTACARADRVQRALLDIQRRVIIEDGGIPDEGVELVVPAEGRHHELIPNEVPGRVLALQRERGGQKEVGHGN